MNDNRPSEPGGDEEPIFKCMTKGIRGAADKFEYGLPWVTARRAFLRVYRDRVECGDWTIPTDAIREASVFETRQMLMKCFILKIRTETEMFQFGLRGNEYWRGDLPFPVTREKGRLAYSKFSIVLRLVLVGVVVWQLFFRNG